MGEASQFTVAFIKSILRASAPNRKQRNSKKGSK